MQRREQERYEKFDLPFYRGEIEGVLPGRVLDFHTHVWTEEAWRRGDGDEPGQKYMITTRNYTIEDLLGDAAMILPGKDYKAVCFGQPTPTADMGRTNGYLHEALGREGLYPLVITGRDLVEPETLEGLVREKGFFGYKVYLGWHGDDYGAVTVREMIGEAEMELADRLGLVVLLHVPGSERLVNGGVQKDVEWLAKEFPQAKIVLAHCGRCYLPDEARKAMGSVAELENVYLDTAMVMDPTVLEIALDTVGPGRVLFGTDLPVANMRGRRVYVMDHWVDLVLPGYPESAYRVGSDNMRATFMVYEIVLAVARAADRVGLSEQELGGVFYDNGRALLESVKR